MSAIKPPEGLGPSAGPDPTQGTAQGAAFADRVATAPAPSPTPVSDPTQAVLAGLRTGAITGDQAVERLTALAIARSGAPPSLRGRVEASVRALLENDPTVAGLLRRMGATVK